MKKFFKFIEKNSAVNKRKNLKNYSGMKTDVNMIGDKLNFASAESYKLLRTNLSFSLPDKQGCKIIGFTSSLKGEGKSITSINTSYSFAESGKRVLLIEADMRMPIIAGKLGLLPAPGLSNIFFDFKNVIQSYGNDVEFDVIVAGDIPPNPSELLGSVRMEGLLDKLSERYDYIIIDLPPVLAVSDALVVSKLLHGIVVVVRQDYNDKASLEETMRQLSFTNVKVLGFVFNCVQYSSKGYYNKKYKKLYYNKSNKTADDDGEII